MATRLTGFSKFLIIATILGLIAFAASKFGLIDKIKGTAQEGTEQVTNRAKDAAAKTISSSDSKGGNSLNTSSFTFKPQAPIGGKLMGVVELGASGFNSFIIKKDSDDNWEKVKYDWGSSLVIDGMATNGGVDRGLRTYIGNILDFGVNGKDIHFVVSSGAKKEKTLQPIIANLKKMGYVVNEVTPEQEGQYALKAALPKPYYNKAYTVDIGSGNTKISWVNGDNINAVEAPGAKYYRKDISNSQAYNDVKTTASKVPHHLAKTCFIIGGVPFNLAKQSRNGDERYTVLEGPSAYTELVKEKGRKVESGLNIYQGVIDGAGTEKFIFDWNANFTIGFLLQLPD